MNAAKYEADASLIQAILGEANEEDYLDQEIKGRPESRDWRMKGGKEADC